MIARGLLSLIGFRATVVAGEHPSGARGDLFGGSLLNSAGVDVNESTALTLSAVWGCVSAISDDVAKVPVHLFERLEAGGRTRVENHPASNLLLNRPNPLMNAMDMRATMMMHVLLWGNAVAEIQRDQTGRPVALWPLVPRWTTLEAKGSDNVQYVYDSPRVGRRVFAPADVFHIRGLSSNGLWGLSVIRAAAQSLGIAIAADRYAGSFFAKGAVPTGVIKMPGKLNPQARTNLQTSWQNLYGGADAQYRTAILEDGAEFVPMSIPAEDMQLLQSRQFSVPEICRYFRCPPHKVFDLSRATFSNIEHQSLEYDGDALLRWWVRWEQEGNAKLIEPERQARMYFSHIAEAKLRTDIKTRYEAYGVGIDKGFLSRDEVRDRENMNPLPDGQGQIFTVQLNNTTMGAMKQADEAGIAPKPDAPTDTGGNSSSGVASPTRMSNAGPERLTSPDRDAQVRALAESLTPAISDACDGLARVESDKARRAAKRSEDMVKWLEAFKVDHRAHVAQAIFGPVECVVRAAAMATGTPVPSIAPIVHRAADAYLAAATITADPPAPDEIERRGAAVIQTVIAAIAPAPQEPTP